MSSHGTQTVDSRLGRIIKEYLEAVERGEDPSAEEWVQRHPDFAEPLREFFVGRQQLNQLLSEAQCAVDAPTLAPSSGTTPQADSFTAEKLRYFGDYELEREIARGGMGVVYQARQVSLNRPVAVKMILAGELASPEDVRRFRTEAEAAANLDHPAIVPIYEIGQRDGQHYFSMKFIDGESLTRWLQARTGQRLTREEIQRRVRLIGTIARGIHYAHQRGIIHRDLKPANILIDSAGQPHITDFGLARRTAHDSELTRTGAIVGTPSYMAPEQALGGGKHATTAVDIYGLGAILYTTLTGRPPFEGETPLQTILQVQEKSPVAPSKLAPEIDQDLETICLKCLEKDPEARYRSAGELADDLQRWERGEPIQAAPPNAARLLTRWLATHFRVAACVLCIGIVTGILICEPPINIGVAHNLGGYALIYRGSFPGEDAPWMLKALEAYPRWIGIVVLPLVLCLYFSMGWLTDRLVKPHDLAGAILSGLGVGTAAAVTAFLVGIGWQTLIQVAVWPSQPDLELLVAQISGDTSFTDGKTIATRYPGDIHGEAVDTRYVMKKALADMQARIPLGLLYGALFAAGLLLLPATLQTVVAQYLRCRGDSAVWQIVHLLEMSIPVSLALVALASFGWRFPWTGAQVLLPLVALVADGLLRRAHPWFRIAPLAMFALLALTLLIVQRQAFLTNQHGANLALVAAGAIAAVIAVVYRFRWWQRLVLYGVWFTAMVLADGFPFGARSALDPGMDIGRQMLVSALGCAALLVLVAVALWMRSRTQSSPLTP